MARRGATLIDRGPEAARRILTHSQQLRAARVISRLIADLRSLESPEQYYEFQRALFAEVFDAQKAQAECSRNVKRQRKGRPVPDIESGSWELEQVVMDRVVRQLRSVGDGLAWRAFGFDRRIFFALSQNAAVGPMYGKVGLNVELSEVETVWHNEHVFGLLHDLTNAVRIADVTKFTPQAALLVEVKQKGEGPRSDQMKRIQRALDVINVGAPVERDGVSSGLHLSGQQFRTRLRDLAAGLAMADDRGLASVRLGRQWVVNCLSFTSQRFPTDFEEGVTQWTEMSRLERPRGRGEGHEEGVALGVDLDAAVAGEGLPQDVAVLRQSLGVRLRAQLVQELRRALDVGEQEGDGS